MTATFLQAMKAFFNGSRPLTVPEFKELTSADKVELSTMLNKVSGYEHEQYVPKTITT